MSFIESHDIAIKTLMSVEKTPHTVYHYTSPEGLFGIFKDKLPKLYFSQYDSLNDMKERHDIVDFLHKYCDILLEQNKMSADLSNAIRSIDLSDNFLITRAGTKPLQLNSGKTIDEYASMSDEECYTYICSFSYEEDSLPMWRMYSKSEHYEGFSLGILSTVFDPFSSFEKGYRIELKRTIYSDEEKTEMFNPFLLPMCDRYDTSTEDEKIQWLNYLKQFIHTNQFVFKNKAFEYEKEVRAILQVPKEKSDSLKNISGRKHRQKNGIIIPYVEYELPYNAIFRINLAPSIKDEVAKKNLLDFLSSQGYRNIKLFSSNVPIRSL